MCSLTPFRWHISFEHPLSTEQPLSFGRSISSSMKLVRNGLLFLLIKIAGTGGQKDGMRIEKTCRIEVSGEQYTLELQSPR